MAALGSAKTNKFIIGTFEFRIGPMNLAGRLTQNHSIGIIESFNFATEVTSVDLKGGFPQKLIDTAITEQAASLRTSLREYSARNMSILLGNPVADYVASGTDKIGQIANGTLTAGTTSLTVGTMSSPFAAGDVVTIYQPTNPHLTSVSVVASATATSVTLTTGLGLAVGMTVAGGSEAYIFKATPIAAGNVTSVNYFSAQLVQLDRGTSRPVVYDFWKVAVASGLEIGASVTEFASTELQLKILEPSSSDYAAGGPLNHQASVIPSYPFARIAASPDFL